ncbi:hypothetical protein FBU31_004014 [Coemansia sp. 'formosensis']|nr:hypothetical protein FBU31_004014 [Coemansia sp. 'formosensis']
MEDECADYQHCEMEALAAIYADTSEFTFTTAKDSRLLSGSIAVEVDTTVSESLVSMVATGTDPGGGIEWFKVRYLPPIELRFTLPGLYPLVDAPRISLSCCWLSAEALECIESRMAEIWQVEQGMCVLDSYINSLRYDLTTMAGAIQIDVKAIEEIAAYDARRRRGLFEMQTYTCIICMESQSGRHCVELGCAHVHCAQCLGGYWGMLVDEGSVWLLRCPHPGCRQSPGGDDLGRVLSAEQVQRYSLLSEQRRVDMDSSRYAWCPREGCGKWGVRDRVQDKLCVCACGYAFCVCCRRVWHGPSFCAIESRQRIMEEYRRAREEGVGLAAMEKQYGKAVLEGMLEREVAEDESLRFIEGMSTACPSCSVRIVKAYGCNHIICSQCNSHFCYLCGELIGRGDPLNHFRMAGSACFMKLLEGVLGDQGVDDPL